MSSDGLLAEPSVHVSRVALEKILLTHGIQPDDLDRTIDELRVPVEDANLIHPHVEALPPQPTGAWAQTSPPKAWRKLVHSRLSGYKMKFRSSQHWAPHYNSTSKPNKDKFVTELWHRFRMVRGQCQGGGGSSGLGGCLSGGGQGWGVGVGKRKVAQNDEPEIVAALRNLQLDHFREQCVIAREAALAASASGLSTDQLKWFVDNDFCSPARWKKHSSSSPAVILAQNSLAQAVDIKAIRLDLYSVQNLRWLCPNCHVQKTHPPAFEATRYIWPHIPLVSIEIHECGSVSFSLHVGGEGWKDVNARS